jgi:hypothetical protein
MVTRSLGRSGATIRDPGGDADSSWCNHGPVQRVACFNSDPEEFDPILWEGPEGEVIAFDWAGGFLDAVALRAQAWRPLIGDDGTGILLAPLFLLNGDLEVDDGAAGEDELLAEASDMIPTCIAGIHEFWRNYRKASPSQSCSKSRGRRRQ